jgi:hypothetical protein
MFNVGFIMVTLLQVLIMLNLLTIVLIRFVDLMVLVIYLSHKISFFFTNVFVSNYFK